MKNLITFLLLVIILNACKKESEFVDIRTEPQITRNGYENGFKPILLQDVYYSKEPIFDWFIGNPGNNEQGLRYRCNIMYKIDSTKFFEYIIFYFPQYIDPLYYENEQLKQICFQVRRTDTDDYHRIKEGYVDIHNIVIDSIHKKVIDFEIYYYYNNDPEIKLKIKGGFNMEYE